MGKNLLGYARSILPPAPGAVVLTYHSVSDDNRSFTTVPYQIFVEQLMQLRNCGYQFTSLTSVCNAISGHENLPKKTVAVTFDDAYEDFYQAVFPLLVSMDIPATVFVPTAFVGKTKQTSDGYRMQTMNWDQLREVTSSQLITIGSHTVSHTSLRNLSDKELKKELEDSRTELESNLGIVCDMFAYPKGKHDSRAIAAVSQVYLYSFSTEPARVTKNADKNLIPRKGIFRYTRKGELLGMVRR